MMSALPDPYQVYQPVTRREETTAERTERVKQTIFEQESGAKLQRDRRGHMPPKRQNLKPGAVCVLDDRGGHYSVGSQCPHGLLTLDTSSITQVSC